MGLCSSDEKIHEEDEFDKLPRGLRWRLKFAGKRSETLDDGTVITRVGDNRIVKRGCESTEYEALRVATSASAVVPIPKILGVYNLREGVLVEMECNLGRPLSEVWVKMSMEQKRTVVMTLTRFLEALRKMEPPKHMIVGSATMGAACDHRFGRKGRIGPFYTLDAFHTYIRRGHPTAEFDEPEVQTCHNKSRSPPYAVRFSHANLCPANILMGDDLRISCLVGWRSAGWYPEYWEYTQMHSNTPKAMDEWLRMMQRAFDKRYDAELVTEKAMRRRYTASDYEIPWSVRVPSPTKEELDAEQKEIDDKNTENTSG